MRRDPTWRPELKSDRFHVIRQYLYANGPSPIAAIAEAVGASLPTLRRDLAASETEGAVLRAHGGARLADQVEGEVAFARRETTQIAAKRAIAEAAYALLMPETTVFLDSGTTVLQLARRIRMAPIPLAIFTNCLPVAQILMDAPGIKLSLLGGGLHKENASVVGPLAEDMLDRLWFSHLFLGAESVCDDGILWSADDREARLNARMVVRSEVRTLLVDSTKFGRRLTHEVAATSQMNRVITDSGLEIWRTDELRAQGVDVQIVATSDRGAKRASLWVSILVASRPMGRW